MYNHKNTMSNPADDILNSFGLPTDTEKGYVPSTRIPRSGEPDPLGLDHLGGKSHRRKARKAAKKSKRSKRSKRSRKARKSAYY